jgi:hypothetical protein
MPITAENATLAQIETRMSQVDGHIRYYRELIGLGPETMEDRRELARWEQMMRYLLRLYEQKGGKVRHVNLPEDRVTVTPPQVVEQQKQEKFRLRVKSILSRCELNIITVRQSLDEAQRRTREDWVIDMLFYQSGGFSATTLMLARSRGMVPAETALKHARQAVLRGDYNAAFANLRVVVMKLELVAGAVNMYYEALGTGAARIEVSIKIGAAIGTGLATAGSGLTLTAGQKGMVGFVEAGSQNLGVLGWEKRFGGKVSPAQIGKALLDSAKSGGSAWVGGWAGEVVAPKVTGLLFKNPSPVQREIVATAVENYFKAHSNIAVDYFTKLASGQQPGYDWWAGLISPVIGTIGNTPGAIDASAAEVLKGEKKIADKLKEKVANKRKP